MVFEPTAACSGCPEERDVYPIPKSNEKAKSKARVLMPLPVGAVLQPLQLKPGAIVSREKCTHEMNASLQVQRIRNHTVLPMPGPPSTSLPPAPHPILVPVHGSSGPSGEASCDRQVLSSPSLWTSLPSLHFSSIPESCIGRQSSSFPAVAGPSRYFHHCDRPLQRQSCLEVAPRVNKAQGDSVRLSRNSSTFPCLPPQWPSAVSPLSDRALQSRSIFCTPSSCPASPYVMASGPSELISRTAGSLSILQAALPSTNVSPPLKTRRLVNASPALPPLQVPSDKLAPSRSPPASVLDLLTCEEGRSGLTDRSGELQTHPVPTVATSSSLRKRPSRGFPSQRYEPTDGHTTEQSIAYSTAYNVASCKGPVSFPQALICPPMPTHSQHQEYRSDLQLSNHVCVTPLPLSKSACGNVGNTVCSLANPSVAPTNDPLSDRKSLSTRDSIGIEKILISSDITYPAQLMDRIDGLEKELDSSPCFQECMSQVQDYSSLPAVQSSSRKGEQKKGPDNIITKYGFPANDNDADICINGTPGLSDHSMDVLRLGLRHHLSKIRSGATTFAVELRSILARQSCCRPLHPDHVNKRIEYVVGRFCKARKQVLRKFGVYVRNRKWIENVATRQRRGCLSHRQNNALRLWLFTNFDNPYPGNEDKRVLTRRTNLSMKQINNWLINARSRVWKPAEEATSMESVRKEFCSEMGSHPHSQ